MLVPRPTIGRWLLQRNVDRHVSCSYWMMTVVSCSDWSMKITMHFIFYGVDIQLEHDTWQSSSNKNVTRGSQHSFVTVTSNCRLRDQHYMIWLNTRTKFVNNFTGEQNPKLETKWRTKNIILPKINSFRLIYNKKNIYWI